MGELKNTFSWSVSAARDFEECPRRRYWGKYAMWNGWSERATDIQRSAYRLAKMENRFTLLGNAVERAVMWMLRRLQRGEPATSEQAYDEAARPFLNRCWLESRKTMWKADPKKFCCLHEHYYPAHHDLTEKEMTGWVESRTRLCIANFLRASWPRLRDVAGDCELPIATVDDGDPESLEVDGIKVYAIPDYAYRRGAQVHIRDWKSGKPSASHAEQMLLYGFWANAKHRAAIGDIHMHVEYLLSGEARSAALSDEDVRHVRETILRSTGDMAEYLVDRDIRKNVPLPGENWEMCADIDTCRRCNFFELCEPELGT